MNDFFPFTDFFFEKGDDDIDEVFPTVCTKLLYALCEKGDGGTFDLSGLWKLYSSSKPSGPLNGGMRMIHELDEVKNLSRMHLIREAGGESYSCESHFSFDSSDRREQDRFMQSESEKFSSRFVSLTPYGKEMTEILRNFENDVKGGMSIADAGRKYLGDEIDVFYDEKHRSILRDEMIRLLRLNKKMGVKDIRLACEEFGFYANSADIFEAAERLCAEGIITRGEKFRCAISEKGESFLKYDGFGGRLLQRLRAFLEKYGSEEDGFVNVPVKIGGFSLSKKWKFDDEEAKTLCDFMVRGYLSMSRTPYEAASKAASKAASASAETVSYLEKSFLAYKDSHPDEKISYSAMLLKFMHAGLFGASIDFEKIFWRCEEIEGKL